MEFARFETWTRRLGAAGAFLTPLSILIGVERGLHPPRVPVDRPRRER